MHTDIKFNGRCNTCSQLVMQCICKQNQENKTPQITIGTVKDEVAKKHGFGNWLALIQVKGYGFLTESIQDEAMELYHTRKCEEAGQRVKAENDDLATDISVLATAKERRQAILTTVEVYCALLEDQKSQLQEAKAEVERFSQFKKWIDEMIEAEGRGGDLSYRQYRIVYAHVKEKISQLTQHKTEKE